MNKIIKMILACVLAVAFVLPLTACEKITKLKIELSIYDTTEEEMQDVTLTFDLYAHLAETAVGEIKTNVKNGVYNDLVFYKQSKYNGTSISTQMMYGDYKIVDGKLVQNEMPMVSKDVETRQNTTGSNLTAERGAIGFWRVWDGTNSYSDSVDFEKSSATLFIPLSDINAYNAYFSLLGKFASEDDMAIIDQMSTLFGADYNTEYTCYYLCDEDGRLVKENGEPVWKSVLTEDFEDFSEEQLENVYAVEKDPDAKNLTKQNKGFEKYTVTVIKTEYLKIKSISVN